ncbi:hypothetical protein LTR36_007286 [Oleoguttula mirabilis]|uniref:Prolyl 4-hydroxylase alpha subunit domain-containing protein n=1 Tax=Oleoguttula mirabilis TaxID=1507867 RepID=A0AAV9JAK4_9PEZI|nr:hypothetical protein LTR36_007286 [Oleoguttula mirabilis]
MASVAVDLPRDFLTKPAPHISVHEIDFAQTDLPKYAGLYAVILDNVLSLEECSTLIKAAENTSANGWERAMINIGGGRQALITDERNCGRIIWDSRDIAGKVWERIEHLPEVQQITRLSNVPRIFGIGPAKRGEVWRFTRPNERMRFLKYVGGEYFRPHCDGSYETPGRKERSYFTMHLYLNDTGATSDAELAKMSATERLEAVKSELVGGATTFHSIDMQKQLDVVPKCGRILLFQHRDLLHSGDDVVQGVKYTMRTDLMYTLESTRSEGKSRMPVLEEPKTGGGSDDAKAAKKARARFGL